MAKTVKTNAIRLLEHGRIAHELVAYSVDPNDLSATHLAQQLGLLPQEVFKTIVLQTPEGLPLVAVIPATGEVDLKKLAKANHSKRVQPLPLKALQATTGYIRGGCSPIGMKKLFPTYIDSSAKALPYIYVSAGMRGLQIKIAPQELQRCTQAEWADICTSTPLGNG